MSHGPIAVHELFTFVMRGSLADAARIGWFTTEWPIVEFDSENRYEWAVLQSPDGIKLNLSCEHHLCHGSELRQWIADAFEHRSFGGCLMYPESHPLSGHIDRRQAESVEPFLKSFAENSEIESVHWDATFIESDRRHIERNTTYQWVKGEGVKATTS